MKRAMTMLGAVAALAVGFLFAAPAAHAASLRTVSNGGVTCEQWPTTYTYPGTYWVCTSNHANPDSDESVVAQVADQKLTAGMKTTLADVEIMIFQNAADFASFTGETAPASKYMAWTAPAGPDVAGADGQWLHGKKIAAVFAEAYLWSSNISPTNQFATRDLTGYYKIHIGQALGRQYDILTADPERPSRPQEEIGGVQPVHIFPIATEYDQFWTNLETGNTVWGATLTGLYSTSTEWEILETLYGASYDDVYAFQFATEFGSGWSHLQSFINSYLHA